MPGFSARPVGAGAAFWTSTDNTAVNTAILLPLGSVVEARDGRMYRWAKAGISDLVAGNVIQAPAQLANYQAATVTTVPIGSTSIGFTPGATAAAANLFAEGFLAITVSTGLGYIYKVSSHPANAGSVLMTVQLDPADPIQVATVTATTKGDLVHNPYQNVIQSPVTTLTGLPVGVAPYIITAAQNGWLQTYGPAAVLTKGTPGPGLPVSVPGSAAGAVVINTAALHIVGYMMETGVDASTNAVFLTLG